MNAYLVEALLGPFGAMSDEELSDARKWINPNESVSVKGLIANVLKPEFDRYDKNSQRLIRDNLSYFLTVGFDHWKSLYEMSMPPIDASDDPRQFFVWLWEVLFPGEDHVMSDLSNVKVTNDATASSQLRIRQELLPRST
jgi:hypothetical protein